MENCKAIRTPVDASTKLVKAIDNDTDIDQKLFQSACFIYHLLLDQILLSL